MGASITASHKLLDFLIKSRGLKNDAELALVLEVAPAQLSKVRHRVNAVSAEFILRIYDKLDMSIAEIRALMD